VAATVTIRLINHLRASALTVDNSTEKKTRAPDKRSPSRSNGDFIADKIVFRRYEIFRLIYTHKTDTNPRYVGAAAGCDLLILLLKKIKRSQPAAAPTECQAFADHPIKHVDEEVHTAARRHHRWFDLENVEDHRRSAA
jgi:hypothetical protein